jgi:hypothetical protein
LTTDSLYKTSWKRRRSAKNYLQRCPHLKNPKMPSIHHNPKLLGVYPRRRGVLAWDSSISNPNLEPALGVKQFAHHFAGQVAPTDMTFESSGISDAVRLKRLL